MGAISNNISSLTSLIMLGRIHDIVHDKYTNI